MQLDSLHQHQPAAEGLGRADAVFQKAYECSAVRRAQYALKRHGHDFARYLFAKVKRALGTQFQGFQFRRAV
jgi:hypothetical protein